MKKEGFLILTTPLLVPLHESPRDYFRYTEYGLRELLSTNGFDITIIEPFAELLGTFISFGIRINQKIWYMLAEKTGVKMAAPGLFSAPCLGSVAMLSGMPRRIRSAIFCT